MTVRVAALAAMAVLLAACSSNPSAGIGRRALENRIKKMEGENVKVVSFSKTNGLMQEGFGVKVYQMQYSAEVEFASDGYSRDSSFVFQASRGYGMKPVHKGDRHTVRGELEFTKTERGWQGADGTVY